ncbi:MULTISPECIES: hypothetical protein [Providencia]|nr:MULTISPECIES: hypothetical protein [Providencia]MDE8745279.1 hypothetical protein [Providencia thailandensis]MDE8764489.1 hypothetical protein [Providencia thailandensis]MDE8776993.1 hypothetical protein [Providencia thailandensis]MDE8780982.1 hypothetical protein [Providencia thailandensis]MDE8784976.1 hypothetical protein [Providencia thailandensis]
MVIKSNILVEYINKDKIFDTLNNYLCVFDLDFDISDYDYFDIEEYKLLAVKYKDVVKDDQRLIDIFSKVNFMYEVDIGTSLTSIESRYLPVITDFIAQKLSEKLHCNVLTSFKSFKGDDDCYVSFFCDGKEQVNLSSFDVSIWDEIEWSKSN